MINKRILITAAIFGIIAVVLGAFGAHGLKEVLDATELDNWKTGVSYQFFHTLVLLFLACDQYLKKSFVNIASYLFMGGIILFSGSLYLLATRTITGLDWLWLIGPVTPIGGLLFILGWLYILIAAIKHDNAGV